MKFMVTWKIFPESYKPAVESFLSSGAPLPAGVKSLGRWHAPGSSYGWHLIEGDINALAEHMAEWAHLLELQITPVIDDSEAGSSLSKAYGK